MRTRKVEPACARAGTLGSGATADAARTVAAEDAKLDGTWKLVVLAIGDDDFAIFKLSQQDSKLTGNVIDAQEMLLGKPDLKEAKRNGDDVTVGLSSPSGQIVFKGKMVKDGAMPARSSGSSTSRTGCFPPAWNRPRARRSGSLAKVP